MPINIVSGGNDGSNTLNGTGAADLIYGFDPNGPQGSVTSIDATRVATGLNGPVFAGSPPGDADRLFIVEQSGAIKILDLNSGQVLSSPFINLASQISDNGESGLLGLTFDPNFASNGYFYVNIVNTDGDTEIRRYQVSATDPNTADPASATLIIEIGQPATTNHKAGWLGFGQDGNLYVALGDGGGGGDPQGNGQNPQSLLGKMLRLDVHGDDFPGDPNRNYAIPDDNPFVGQAGVRGEIYALGLRNPFRDSFDRATGDLYIGDVGQSSREEIDLGASGANYGWNAFEGDQPFDTGTSITIGDLTSPIHSYGRSVGSTVIGGYVYRGGGSEGLQGQYFFADFGAGTISTLRFDGSNWIATDRTGQITTNVGSIDNPASFGEDGRGNLYVVDIDGDIFRLTPNQTSADIGDTISGAGGADMIYGGSGNDTLGGDDGNDTLYGGKGNDLINGGNDHDLIFGDENDDTLNGDGGNDKIYGDAGNDIIDGGTGDDILDGGAGDDQLTGGGGNDIFIYRGNGADTIVGFVAGAGARINVTTGFAAFDDFIAAAVQDGADTFIDFGSGNTLTLLGVTKGDLGSGDFIFPDIPGVTIVGDKKSNIIDATHSVGNQPFATDGDDTISGLEGNDVISGLGGDDRLDGGKGNDTLNGGNGDDLFVVTGNKNYLTDVFNGGNGDADAILVTGATAAALASFNASSADIERWIGNNHELLGTKTANVFDLSGLTSVTGLTFIDGGEGSDTIIGSDAWDGDLRGGKGNDTLHGGTGNDHLTGGANVDTFIFAVGDGEDTIVDFAGDTMKGRKLILGDKIELSGLGSEYTNDVHNHMTEVGGNVEINFNGTDKLTINNTTIAFLDAHSSAFLFV